MLPNLELSNPDILAGKPGKFGVGAPDFVLNFSVHAPWCHAWVKSGTIGEQMHSVHAYICALAPLEDLVGGTAPGPSKWWPVSPFEHPPKSHGCLWSCCAQACKREAPCVPSVTRLWSKDGMRCFTERSRHLENWPDPCRVFKLVHKYLGACPTEGFQVLPNALGD